MFCTSCGNQLPDGATTCPNCGRSVGYATPMVSASPLSMPPAVQINNYLVPAILVTLCCCLPGGVVAIIYAAQVNTKLQTGDVAGAEAAAKNAKMWCWIGFGGGVLVALIYGFLTSFAIINQR
jgi:Interferon-induced transmembrane protein/zinc-ribbon domain